MSMSIPKRQEACLHFIRNGFDADTSIAWVLSEYADDETVQRAKHPERLARNIISMGGTGDQKEMNIAAFGRAFDVFVREQRDREIANTRKHIAGLEADLRTANDRWASATSEVGNRERRLQEMQQRVDDLTRRTHQHALEAGAPATDT